MNNNEVLIGSEVDMLREIRQEIAHIALKESMFDVARMTVCGMTYKTGETVKQDVLSIIDKYIDKYIEREQA